MACCARASSCNRALSKAIPACVATLTSTSRSPSLNCLLRSKVSTCRTPNTSPPIPNNGTHIIDRILKSAILWLASNCWSEAASADKIASLRSITRLTIVRLILIVSAASSRRALDQRGTSVPDSSNRPINARSACMNTLNNASRTLGKTSPKLKALPKACVISSSADSFTSGLAVSWICPGPEPTSSLDIIVPVFVSAPSKRTLIWDPSRLSDNPEENSW